MCSKFYDDVIDFVAFWFKIDKNLDILRTTFFSSNKEIYSLYIQGCGRAKYNFLAEVMIIKCM